MLDSASPKLRCQDARIGQVVGEQPATAKVKAKPIANSGPQSSSTSKHLPEKKAGTTAAAAHRPGPTKKAVVVEDSQDRGGVIEDSQHPGLQRLPSSDVLHSTNPVTYMPKVIQDLVAAPSSPLTDPPPTPPPVTDGRVTNPPSRRGRVVEDSQAAGMSSQELGNDYGTPSQHSVWTLSKSTTKTKSRSVERSVIKISQPIFGRMPQALASGQALSPTSRYTNVQANQKAQGILKPANLKRAASSHTQPGNSQGDKRQKLSSQVSTGEELSKLRPARTSAANPGKKKSSKQSKLYLG